MLLQIFLLNLTFIVRLQIEIEKAEKEYSAKQREVCFM